MMQLPPPAAKLQVLSRTATTVKGIPAQLLQQALMQKDSCQQRREGMM